MSQALADIFSLTGNNIPDIIDLCDLEAPEPMVRILSAGAQLGAEDIYLARLPHVPFPLFPLLEKRELDWQIHEEEDGRVLILIRRQA
jgi:hypothetical protein